MFSLDIVNLTKQTVPLKTLERVLIFAAQRWHIHGELSLVLAGDSRLRTLNRDFRGYDRSTDVLSFSAPTGTPGALGEIFVNLADCQRPAKYREIFKEKQSFIYLLLFLSLHGLLHLAGYEDETESGRLAMVAKGEKMMKELVKNAIIKEHC